MNHIHRILLVEDDPRDVTLTLEALKEFQLANDVAVVHDGAAALDYLYCRGSFATREPGLPVVMLLDLKLPKLSGADVLKQVKEDPELRTLPVVILTSSREDRDLSACYELGVNAYVVKPVDFHQFVDAVKGLGVFWAAINEPPRPRVAFPTPPRGAHAHRP